MDAERHRQLTRELQRVLNVLISEYHPDKVILFGSLVRGDIHPWSDIDLVIIKATDRRFAERLVDVALLCDSDLGVDCLVYTPEEFRQMVADGNSFIREVLQTGRVLYEREAVPAVA